MLPRRASSLDITAGPAPRLLSLSSWSGRQALADQGGTILDEFAILLFEGRLEVAVDIEFSHHFSASENGNHNLRLGFERTSQVARILADVIDHHCFTRGGRRAADSLV